MAAEVWEVVGGFDKGGILVREGGDSTSKQCEERLAFGALVQKVELRDVKLHYRLLLGDGPIEGWVSTKITGKSLVTRCLDVSKVRKALEATPPEPKPPSSPAPAEEPAASAKEPAKEPPAEPQPPPEADAPAPAEAPRPPDEAPAPEAAGAGDGASEAAWGSAAAGVEASSPQEPPAVVLEPERRMAEDGVFYTQPEFRECYGSDAEWESRAEVGFAGFEGYVDDAAGGHFSTEVMSLGAAKARCIGDRSLAGFCYDTVGGTIPPEGELTVHFKTGFELTPAPGSGWWAWKVGWPVLPAPEAGAREQSAAPAAEPASDAEAAAPSWPLSAELAARISERCTAQKAQPIVWWNWIESETVKAGCNRTAAGLFYELTFPWNRETLVEKGPEWLTRAFHAAGTLDRENKITELTVQDKSLFISDCADHIFFEVAYEKDDPTLHTQLVAKVPLPLDGETYRDRLVSSYFKQPWDMYEVNAHRLFESELPMRTPRYYFGDISNETSNYILVVEQLPFAGFSGEGAAAAPGVGEIEGPYAACRDDQLRRPAKEYYLAIMRMHAALAAKHQKCQELLQSGLMSAEADSLEDPEAWGVEPGKPTFEDLQIVLRRLEAGISFFAGTAKAVFPPYVATEAFQAKLRATMTNLQAYHSEINYWKHKDPRYVALVHGNLSVDNAFFWTGEGGSLEAGVRDCSGLGVFSVPHRIWWSLACADFENVHANLDEYIDTFVALYREQGGPAVDRAVVRRAIILTAVDSLMLMVNAVPKCLRLCPAEEWSTIQGLDDPRLAGAAGGRGFVRRTLKVLLNGLRVIEEMDGPQVLDSWIQEVYVQEWGETPKSIAQEE